MTLHPYMEHPNFELDSLTAPEIDALSSDSMKDRMRRRSISSFFCTKKVSSKVALGMNSLKKSDHESKSHIGIYSNAEDDGSIASKILNICKSSQGIGSQPSSCKTAPKMRGVRLEYCTEGLGSESSDVSPSFFPHNEEKEYVSVKNTEIKLANTNNDCKMPSFSDDGNKENRMRERNWHCLTERAKSLKCNSRFPPPLSTLMRGGYQHLPNASLVCLRPFRMEGRFILKEVRAPPCRDFLRASRKDGRLRLELITQSDSPCKACQGDSLLEKREANLERGEEASLSMKNETAVVNAVEKTVSKVESNFWECSNKDMKQELASLKLKKSNFEAMKGMVGEALLFEERNKEISIPSSSMTDMANKHQDLGSPPLSLGFSSDSPTFTKSISPMEQLSSFDASQNSVDDNSLAEINALQPSFDQRSEDTKVLEGAFPMQSHGERQESRSRKLKKRTKGEHMEEQESVANALVGKAGSDTDLCVMPSSSPSPNKSSSSLSDLQFSLARMQTVILSNTESLHVSCKNVLDGRTWKKGVPPLVGLSLRC